MLGCTADAYAQIGADTQIGAGTQIGADTQIGASVQHIYFVFIGQFITRSPYFSYLKHYIS